MSATRTLAAASGHNNLCARFPAHPVDGSRNASSGRKLETSRPVRHGSNRTVGTADDGSLAKRRRRAKVQNKTYVLGLAFEGYLCPNLDIERRIFLSAPNAGSNRSGASRPLDVHHTRSAS